MLVFVVAQHAALAHGVSHLFQGASGGDDPSLPQHTKVCDQCHQLTQLGSGLAPSTPRVAFATPCFLPPAWQHDSVFEAPPARPLQSRAPPVFL